ncbi:major facilitator superfamily domain-containing protein [Boeremia exigua]|uniref:major facilitator superfamily domain-containing protein n=1 Tax=Boeremia exigua TaxID=749465 RepID=UPI001E8E7942|nr:major facilitator superfamily domain-containing protein [Boeremia exigua]KAH6620128.1 major facilitator superfamily domain-containing protein [Boeremia exigua]
MGLLGSLRKQPAQAEGSTDAPVSTPQNEKSSGPSRKWNLGILSDPLTDEVPGSVILLSKTHNRNEPLGLQHAHARTSASSLPSAYGHSRSASRGSRHSSRARQPEKKRTKDGRFILEPQPEESANDPLNWNQFRRDAALLSLGFFCMLGGGMTPILAAGFHDVAETYDVGLSQVALTTGLYMLGLGLGSVVASPTAILWGKRPVYLVAIVLFTLSSVWCALSPNYASLVIARIVQGFAVSPVECLPSATIAEIFFLHERAYRLGVYTLLLLGGKNLIPLVSAAIVQSLGWRWVFWVIAIVVGVSFFLIFFFVPETFWDRTPRARGRSHARSRSHSPRRHNHFHLPSRHHKKSTDELAAPVDTAVGVASPVATPLDHPKKAPKTAHVGFADDVEHDTSGVHADAPLTPRSPISIHSSPPGTPRQGYFPQVPESTTTDPEKQDQTSGSPSQSSAEPGRTLDGDQVSEQFSIHYTDYYRTAPTKTYRQSLKPWNGRLAKDKWFKVAVRPFILFAYPAVLWSSLVYALAVGWLIVLSESVAHVYQNRESYNFTSLQVGLVYISPFVGGVLGTAVAGKVSDLIVRFMARRNDGVYEPEFRLVMALPITISTVIGLMGFGWSAEEKDHYIVPTIFFGVISFGCCLASTTAITFVVDSYRVYAGEALVTLNFCKNVLHGFIFSLFFPHWLEAKGPKSTFLAVGGIQLGCMLFSIPMYIYGKRARMWTVRKNLMEKF